MLSDLFRVLKFKIVFSACNNSNTIIMWIQELVKAKIAIMLYYLISGWILFCFHLAEMVHERQPNYNLLRSFSSKVKCTQVNVWIWTCVIVYESSSDLNIWNETQSDKLEEEESFKIEAGVCVGYKVRLELRQHNQHSFLDTTKDIGLVNRRSEEVWRIGGSRRGGSPHHCYKSVETKTNWF